MYLKVYRTPPGLRSPRKVVCNVSRFCHYVKDNKSSETIHHCLFIDCETDQVECGKGEVKHTLRFGWACYQRRDSRLKWRNPDWTKFTTHDELYDFILRKIQSKIKLYVFVHNSNFDYPVLRLFEWFDNIGAKMGVAVLSGPPTIVRYRYKTATIVLLDTLNIWRVPLEKIGKIVDCRKLPMPDKNDKQEQWDEYGRRDVEIIRRAITKWADFLMLNDFGGFAPTLAGQSMRLYRHRFLTTGIAIHNNEKALELERNCYHGGRNECFFIGHKQGRFKLLDINSMYPFVMGTNRFPHRLKRTYDLPKTEHVRYLLSQQLLCGKFLLVSNVPAYPVVKDSKLIFPVGEYDAYLTTPEIEYALEHNHIKKCYQLASYDGANIFASFIDYLYNKRLQAENESAPTDAYLYKKLMNSHYGKWGQRGYRTEFMGNAKDKAWRVDTIIDGQTGKPIKRRQLGNRIEYQYEEGSAKDAFPAIAAHVTAYARMYLFRLIQRIGIGNVFYCDTDSILTNSHGVSKLKSYIHASRLGGLKIEGSYKSITIYGCKDYQFDDKERHKGVKSKAQWLTSNSVKQDRWDNLRGMLRNGRIHEPHTKTITKTLHRNYTKGIMAVNGIVEPIQLCLSS